MWTVIGGWSVGRHNDTTTPLVISVNTMLRYFFYLHYYLFMMKGGVVEWKW